MDSVFLVWFNNVMYMIVSYMQLTFLGLSMLIVNPCKSIYFVPWRHMAGTNSALFDAWCSSDFYTLRCAAIALQLTNIMIPYVLLCHVMAYVMLCSEPNTIMPQDIFSCDQAALWMVFSVCPSVCLSVCPSHLFDYVPIIVSSWYFQELSLRTRVRSMQKVKVRGQRSRSQRSQPNLTVSGL